LAVLKLVEQGKITFDTPVEDYLSQFRNPIIVDRTDTKDTNFRPAETVVTLRHLLTMTSGVFTHRDYDSGRISESHCSKEMHRSEDPISEFFRIVMVGPFFFGYFHAVNHSARESFPLCRCNSNQELTVSRSRPVEKF
jgi:Beta-lactamase